MSKFSDFFPNSGVAYDQKWTPELQKSIVDYMFSTYPDNFMKMPELNENDEIVNFLVSISNTESEVIALYAEGDYTVDWGDGTIENFASGETAEHKYDFNNSNLFKHESDVDFKQAIVKITPQSPGGLTYVDLINYTYTGQSSSNFNPIYAISINAVNLAYIKISELKNLFYFNLNKNNITDASNLLEGCTTLRIVDKLNLENADTANNVFNICSSLITINELNIPLLNDATDMFYNCAIISIPEFNAPNCTLMTYAFQSCYQLKYIPVLNLPVVENIENLFDECSSLEYFPGIYAPLAVSATALFSNCFALKVVNELDLPSLIDATDMFEYCYELRELPDLNFENCQYMRYMFYYCESLVQTKNINCQSAIDMGIMFLGCYSLKKTYLLNTGNCKDFGGIFDRCYSLEISPNLNLSAMTDLSNLFGNNYSLKKINHVFDNYYYEDFSNSLLSSTELNRIFEMLPDYRPSGLRNIVTIDNPRPALIDNFGYSVDISDSYVVVGAYNDDTTGTDSGAAYVFNIDGSLLHTLENPRPADGDNFGISVAISDSYVVVGAYNDDTSNYDSGAVYVFSTTDGSLVHTLENPRLSMSAMFGRTIDISDSYIVVSAYNEDTTGIDSGTVYVFSTAGGSLVHTLENPRPTNDDKFGISVAISDSYVVVGTPYENTTGNYSGAVYVFSTADGSLVHTLENPRPTDNDKFGMGVAISDSYFVVGSPLDEGTSTTRPGAVYVFNINGSLVHTLENPRPAFGVDFGFSVSISDSYIVVGAYNDDTTGTNSGAAYVFSAIDGSLVHTLENQTPGNYDYFGADVSISGSNVLIGSYSDDTGVTNAGAAYVFDLNSYTEGVDLSSLPSLPQLNISNSLGVNECNTDIATDKNWTIIS